MTFEQLYNTIESIAKGWHFSVQHEIGRFQTGNKYDFYTVYIGKDGESAVSTAKTPIECFKGLYEKYPEFMEDLK